MKTKILVAGATGDLGGRIVKALVKRGAHVIAIVRVSSDNTKIDELKGLGAEIVTVDMTEVDELVRACVGVHCVVSVLAGLRDVIVDAQSALLDAAVKAGVPRFIPSDFASDFTHLPVGENRNFDLRKEFHAKLDEAPVAATSVFIGAFADIISYNTPFFDQKNHTIGYWGDNADWKIDFTAKDDAAAYTAAVALDDDTPTKLNIASLQVSANDMQLLAKKLKGQDYKLISMGSLDKLSAYNKRERAAHPEGENELYPKWQQSQYMHSMFSVHHDKLDNDRYSDLVWTAVKEII
jgi:nucleoside-diphosphate-sugar epimerase